MTATAVMMQTPPPGAPPGANVAGDFKADLLAAIPALRAFAVSLSGKSGWADDLVQETLVKAWANQASFQPGSRMHAWLFTILRHEYYSEYRRRRYEVPDPDGMIAATLTTRPAQDGHVAFREFQVALSKLAPGHREALILVGASGFSYEEAAGIAQCAVGTMKSRVARARGRLAQFLVNGEHQSVTTNDPQEAIAAGTNPPADR